MIHVTSSMFMKNGGTCRALDATGDGDEKHRGTVDGFLGKRVPPRPPAAAGRLTLNA